MKLPFVLLFLSSIALADIGPRPPKCKVPEGCTTCAMSLADESFGQDCRAGALDAGLVQSECSDRQGSGVTRYFCPKDSPATRPSCASVDVLGLSGLLFLLRRRRER